VLVIGLTGGIGSGKTAASEQFAALGVPVIDADQLSRELTRPGMPALRQIVDCFGADILTPAGQLDRAALRERIFSDPAARQKLEDILHPAIRQEMSRRLKTLQSPYAVLVIPLLIEAGQQDLVDRILLIDVPPALQRRRVLERDKISAEQLDNILSAQLSREQRLADADDIINNEGDLADLRQAIGHIHQTYLALSSGEGFTHPPA